MQRSDGRGIERFGGPEATTKSNWQEEASGGRVRRRPTFFTLVHLAASIPSVGSSPADSIHGDEPGAFAERTIREETREILPMPRAAVDQYHQRAGFAAGFRSYERSTTGESIAADYGECASGEEGHSFGRTGDQGAAGDHATAKQHQ